MSQYVNFFIRIGDRFAPIFSRSRSFTLYQVTSHELPYEGIRAIKVSDIKRWKSAIDHEIKKAEKSIIDEKERIEMVGRFNNSVQEKLDFIDDTKIFIEDAEVEIEEMKSSIAFLEILEEMLDEADSTKYYNNDYPDRVLDPDKYIYAGVECGLPGLEDVRE